MEIFLPVGFREKKKSAKGERNPSFQPFGTIQNVFQTYVHVHIFLSPALLEKRTNCAHT